MHEGMNKVAQVTLAFWIMKICATTLGETGGDILTKTHEQGGLDLGTIGSSVVLGAFLVSGTLVLASTHRQEKSRSQAKVRQISAPRLESNIG